MLSQEKESDQQLFERIAEGYSAKDRYAPSRRARRQRLEQTLARLELPANCWLLEVGCGAGYAASYLRGRYAEFLGMDYSVNLIAHAEKTNAGPGVSFVAADIMEYTPPHTYDAVFMIGVLHHLADPPAAAMRLAEWVAPGGWLVANEPQPGNPIVSWARGIRKSTDNDYSEEQLQLKAATIADWYTKAGLIDVRSWWQGLFSTPFAEVRIAPQWLAGMGATVTCAIDRTVERYAQGILPRLSWNVVVAGRRAP